ncbi:MULTISPECIES: chemotaxis protein CheW [Trichocoleus]|uniref:Chemotaxis protein CheW n=1 Tax=Trichocoleus desertorum GB2-A4 TaxID=2933944 RepID=A0ABV0J8R7_9CYAN|nr:chemotaxis protein CheW [Trichocoleus sp. FACHB-46]MBD1862605.1 purine-binding chemotaxis protein CheW [Trichocoleus sp. FACHB-46]
MNQLNLSSPSERCWNTIGVSGDRACPELLEMIHCRNCPVYAQAGRSLLEREIPANYLLEWASSLAEEKIEQTAGTLSVVIFRLGQEWLALSALLFQEITQVSSVRTLPHRSNQIFQGLVNIRGELQLCISLRDLLGIGQVAAASTTHQMAYQRMVVVQSQKSSWVFPVDEVYGVQRIHPDDIRNLPATLSNAKDTYTKGIINWQNHSVNYLDDELLFYTLNRRLL